MATSKTHQQRPFLRDLSVLGILAAVSVAVHLLLGNRFGFHRDELQFLDDARHLAWGYVAYPPLTSFLGRVAVSLFGVSPLVFRLPAMVAAAVNLVLAGLVARVLGGSRTAQVFALLTVLAGQMVMGGMMMYVVFDFLAWALLTLFVAKLLATGDERWWLAVGAAVGLGVLSKYTIAFLVVSLLAGLLLLPSQHQHLRSRWFYLGAALALLIAAPNLVWEARHHWVSLKMLSAIHARDVRIGRAAGFLPDQLKFTMFSLPFAVAGAVWLARRERFRLLLFLYLGPLLLLYFGKGRGYYLMPAYTALFAAGAVWFEEKTAPLSHTARHAIFSGGAFLLVADAVLLALLMMPVSRIGSPLFFWQLRQSSDLRDEFGWPELTAAVADARDRLPAEERDRIGIVADNYGEAGALALYGPRYGLPYPISAVNSFFYRGYGNAPDAVLTLGMDATNRAKFFATCSIAGEVKIPYTLHLDDQEDQPIYVCRHPLRPWSELWPHVQHFG